MEAFPADPVLRYAFELMLAEVLNPNLATQAMTEVLMKQCLILLLRRQLTASDFTSPILAALQDPKLARAVLAILEQPGARYSVDGLAALAGMGRTSFAEAFAAAFGQGPMEFVQRVRLRIASRLLTGTDLPVKVIAATVGYASRSAFSKAFEVEFGTAPSQFRMIGGMDEGEPERIESELPDTKST
ncbi:helix-turn-helix domain-containing protein [Methylobacterium sp.]|uniref:helix-turn-helix domain-containing protein n=1 Tax=Methylobacterium sp. TaxID=409 RepID=UPI003AFFE493